MGGDDDDDDVLEIVTWRVWILYCAQAMGWLVLGWVGKGVGGEGVVWGDDMLRERFWEGRWRCGKVGVGECGGWED